tara:strand:- start:182 stop:346 length:165 start_codon:yes stop_codon:yes gene_type:complete
MIKNCLTPKIIWLYRRRCVDCGHRWFGDLKCPLCFGFGEPLQVEGKKSKKERKK